jgi:hypothetical protein
MVNKKNIGIGIIAIVAVVFIAFVASNSAYAYKGNSEIKGPYYSEDRHLEMEKAFDNLDYDAWKNLMSQNNMHPRVLDVVTKDNFARFAEMHKAKESGDLETANKIRSELGLGNGMMNNQGLGSRGTGCGMHSGNGQGRLNR